MSTFDLTEQEIETIRNSTEPDHILAGRYRIGLSLVNAIRPSRRYVEAHGYKGKTSGQRTQGGLYMPSLFTLMNQHKRSRPSSDQIDLDFRSLLHGGESITPAKSQI